MQYSSFSTSNLKIFRLGFGGMGLNGVFGKQADDYMIRSVLNALDQGVNFIDTARA